MKVLDSHVHLINPEEITYPWLDEAPPLKKYFGVEEYAQATEGLGIEKMIFMEVAADIKENIAELDWVTSLMEKDPRLQGMIANIDLTDKSVLEETLEKLSSYPGCVGIRHITQGNDCGYTNQSAYVEGVKATAKAGLNIDLCIYHHQLEDVLDLVSQCPEASFMMDHMAKPGIKAGEVEPWKSHMSKLSEFENVHCKVSALLTEADTENWKDEEFIPYIHHVIEAFGSKRIVYGGDWPVVTLAGTYQDWFRVCAKGVEILSETEKEDLYYQNGNRFYFGE